MDYLTQLTSRLLRSMSVAAGWAAFLSVGQLVAGIVQVTPIGAPAWAPVDFQVFSAPAGTAASGYAEFVDTLLAVLPPPNHEANPALGIGPGTPHDPPYNSEISAGVLSLGYHEGSTFTPAEFSNGRAVYFAWMNIPAPGVMGSSPDFTLGPVIPNSLFPIHVSGSTLRNGSDWNPFLTAFDVPPLDGAVDPRFASVDGHSHFPIFVADNADFGPPGGRLDGIYTYRIEMLDSTGNGWRAEATFQVVPEPWSLGLVAVSLMAILLFRRRALTR